MTAVDHLALAKEDLAIAESADAKREAYKRAAEHIAAHKKESGDTWAALARALGRDESKVRLLDQWRRSGFKAETPYLMDDKATTRAAKSHAKAVLKDPEQRTELAESMTSTERTEAINALMAANAKDSGLDHAVEKNRQRNHEEEARKMTDRALDSLKARGSYYGDIPVNDDEHEWLGWVIRLAQGLRGESEMDEAIEELMSNAK